MSSVVVAHAAFISYWINERNWIDSHVQNLCKLLPGQLWFSTFPFWLHFILLYFLLLCMHILLSVLSSFCMHDLSPGNYLNKSHRCDSTHHVQADPPGSLVLLGIDHGVLDGFVDQRVHVWYEGVDGLHQSLAALRKKLLSVCVRTELRLIYIMYHTKMMFIRSVTC